MRKKMRPKKDKFQSTRPLRGATFRRIQPRGGILISIHAPLAGRDTHRVRKKNRKRIISIHAPLAGRDCGEMVQARVSDDFNPRAPCGARLSLWMRSTTTAIFQSTRPLRGATSVDIHVILARFQFQSTRPLRGATLSNRLPSFSPKTFQSTRPLRGATANVHKKYVHVCENRQKKLFSLPNAVCQSA